MFKCGYESCGKSFTTKGNLKQHSLRHDDRSFECEECGKSFATKSELTKHLSRHNDRSFKCEKCGKSFTTRSDLTQHLSRHNDRSFKCKECGKLFKTNRELTRHSLSHKKEFKCDKCGKLFMMKYTCAWHQRKSCNNIQSLQLEGLETPSGATDGTHCGENNQASTEIEPLVPQKQAVQCEVSAPVSVDSTGPSPPTPSDVREMEPSAQTCLSPTPPCESAGAESQYYKTTEHLDLNYELDMAPETTATATEMVQDGDSIAYDPTYDDYTNCFDQGSHGASLYPLRPLEAHRQWL